MTICSESTLLVKKGYGIRYT